MKDYNEIRDVLLCEIREDAKRAINKYLCNTWPEVFAKDGGQNLSERLNRLQKEVKELKNLLYLWESCKPGEAPAKWKQFTFFWKRFFSL